MTRTRILLTAVGMLALIGVGLLVGATWAMSRGSPETYIVARVLTPEEVDAGVAAEWQSFDTFEAAMASIRADPDDLPPARTTGDHCVSFISPVQPGKRGSVVSNPQCYSTFSDAWAAAERGPR